MVTEIFGCDKNQGTRSCNLHETCGSVLSINDVVVFRFDEPSNAVKVYLTINGTESCHVGFLPRFMLRRKGEFVDFYFKIIEDFRYSVNFAKRQRSIMNGGVLLCEKLENS